MNGAAPERCGRGSKREAAVTAGRSWRIVAALIGCCCQQPSNRSRRDDFRQCAWKTAAPNWRAQRLIVTVGEARL